MSTTKRNIYLGLIGLAGLALLVDRVLLGGATTAPAEAAAVQPVSSASGAEPAASVRDPVPRIRFPEGLVSYASGALPRDPFAPPLAAADRVAVDAKAPQRAITQADFAARHTLSAVMSGSSDSVAVVDGVVVRAGDSVDGCDVIGIAPRRVRFSCVGVDVELALRP